MSDRRTSIYDVRGSHAHLAQQIVYFDPDTGKTVVLDAAVKNLTVLETGTTYTDPLGFSEQGLVVTRAPLSTTAPMSAAYGYAGPGVNGTLRQSLVYSTVLPRIGGSGSARESTYADVVARGGSDSEIINVFSKNFTRHTKNIIFSGWREVDGQFMRAAAEVFSKSAAALLALQTPLAAKPTDLITFDTLSAYAEANTLLGAATVLFELKYAGGLQAPSQRLEDKDKKVFLKDGPKSVIYGPEIEAESRKVANLVLVDFCLFVLDQMEIRSTDISAAIINAEKQRASSGLKNLRDIVLGEPSLLAPLALLVVQTFSNALKAFIPVDPTSENDVRRYVAAIINDNSLRASAEKMQFSAQTNSAIAAMRARIQREIALGKEPAIFIQKVAPF